LGIISRQGVNLQPENFFEEIFAVEYRKANKARHNAIFPHKNFFAKGVDKGFTPCYTPQQLGDNLSESERQTPES